MPLLLCGLKAKSSGLAVEPQKPWAHSPCLGPGPFMLFPEVAGLPIHSCSPSPSSSLSLGSLPADCPFVSASISPVRRTLLSPGVQDRHKHVHPALCRPRHSSAFEAERQVRCQITTTLFGRQADRGSATTPFLRAAY